VFHQYAFTPRYIRKLLYDHGFVQTTVLNSPPTEGDPNRVFLYPTLATFVKTLVYSVARCTETISYGRWLLGSSLEVTAVKPE
jgi:hypothetical protein